MNDGLFHGDLVNTSRIIYTPSSFAKLALLHLQEIGTLQATKPHTSGRENLSSYLFFVVLSGSGNLTYDDTNYELKQGDCVFINCRKPYSHATSNDLWKLSWVHFDGPTADNIYMKYLERGGLPAFSPRNMSIYEGILKDLQNIAQSDSYVRDMEINEGLSKLLVCLMKDAWRPDTLPAFRKKTDLYSIKNYLDTEYAKKITLDDLSQRFYINKYYLTRIFKEQFGTTINGYLLSVRITHAKSELRFTDKSIEQIGLDCGLGAGYYFSRTFRTVEGISPSEYRGVWAPSRT